MSEPLHLLAALAARSGSKAIFQPCDFAAAGLHPEQVRRLLKAGSLQKAGRGRYVLPGSELPDEMGVALVAAAAPSAVICLLTALRMHGIGSQAQREIWIAVDRRAAKPRIDYPPVRVVRFSGPALTFGIETRIIGGTPVRVTSPAKTVADCFKYRNKIGLDVAIEALKDALGNRKTSRDELWAAAAVCRVTRVIRPYIEMI
jgi:predicted transcriptional regulator of viral defense system